MGKRYGKLDSNNNLQEPPRMARNVTNGVETCEIPPKESWLIANGYSEITETAMPIPSEGKGNRPKYSKDSNGNIVQSWEEYDLPKNTGGGSTTVVDTTGIYYSGKMVENGSFEMLPNRYYNMTLMNRNSAQKFVLDDSNIEAPTVDSEGNGTGKTYEWGLSFIVKSAHNKTFNFSTKSGIPIKWTNDDVTFAAGYFYEVFFSYYHNDKVVIASFTETEV